MGKLIVPPQYQLGGARGTAAQQEYDGSLKFIVYWASVKDVIDLSERADGVWSFVD